MNLSDEMKPIVDEILTSLASTHPQWKCKANFDLKDPIGAFDIIVKDVARDRLYQLRVTQYDAQPLLKMPRAKAVDGIIAYLISNSQKAFDEDRGLALPQKWDDANG